jgi:hypothetical protein
MTSILRCDQLAADCFPYFEKHRTCSMFTNTRSIVVLADLYFDFTKTEKIIEKRLTETVKMQCYIRETTGHFLYFQDCHP